MNNFTILSKLGEGSFSTVYKVLRNSDSQTYALKKVKLPKLSQKEKLQALNEVRILASINNPNIVTYKEAFLEEASQTLNIVMEFAEGGDLDAKIRRCRTQNTRIPEAEVWSLFIQLLKGLQALHDLKIVHRDVKSANLFLTKDGTLKLGDLNVSKVAKGGMLQTQTGTPYYCSPEVWQGRPYNFKSDVWSAGCVLYEMCELRPPFQATSMDQLCRRCCSGVVPSLSRAYSFDLNTMVRLCLQQVARVRPSCSELFATKELVRNIPPEVSTHLEQPGGQLISTIQLPINLEKINERLPSPNYFQALPNKQFQRQTSLPELAQSRVPQSSRAEARRNNKLSDQLFKETLKRPEAQKPPSGRGAARDYLNSQMTSRRPPVSVRKRDNNLPPLPQNLRKVSEDRPAAGQYRLPSKIENYHSVDHAVKVSHRECQRVAYNQRYPQAQPFQRAYSPQEVVQGGRQDLLKEELRRLPRQLSNPVQPIRNSEHLYRPAQPHARKFVNPDSVPLRLKRQYI